MHSIAASWISSLFGHTPTVDLDLPRPSWNIISQCRKNMAAPTCNGDIGAAIGSMLSGDRDLEDSLWGHDALKEKEIIEKQRVQLTTYINDVTILFPYMQEANLFNRDDKEIINAPVTTTAKVDKFLDVMLTKGECESILSDCMNEIAIKYMQRNIPLILQPLLLPW